MMKVKLPVWNDFCASGVAAIRSASSRALVCAYSVSSEAITLVRYSTSSAGRENHFSMRAIDQAVREKEQEDHRPQRQQQCAQHHLAAETRAQHARLALGIEAQQSANQDERQRDEEQENQRRNRGEDDGLFAGVRLQKRQLEGGLRQNDGEQKEDANRQRDNRGGAAAFLRLTNWRGYWQGRSLIAAVNHPRTAAGCDSHGSVATLYPRFLLHLVEHNGGRCINNCISAFEHS